jgi:hypothetical protein
MRFSRFIVLLALYLPIFGMVLPFIGEIPRLVDLSIALVLSMILIKIKRSENALRYIRKNAPVIVFGVYCFLVMLSKGVVAGDWLVGFHLPEGLLLGTLIIFWLIYSNALVKYEEFLNKLTSSLGLFLFLQVMISVYESYYGRAVGRPSGEFFSLAQRDMLSLFGTSLTSLFGLQTAFTGLMGQYNIFGVVLTFYNLLFLKQFVETRRVIFLLLMILVFVAVIGNSTRACFLAVLITDLLALVAFVRKGFLKYLVVLALSVLIVSVVSDIASGWEAYISRSDTLTFRFQVWNYVSSYVPQNPMSILFGLPLSILYDISSTIWGGGTLGSYENQYLRLYVYNGLIGLFLFVYLFIISPIVNVRPLDKNDKIISRLFGLNVLLTSLTLDVFDYFAAYLLAMLLYLSLRNKTNASAVHGLSSKSKETVPNPV